ncbi:hypothetical protein GW17_00061894 [Ensete ventricosum]|nr:hypothetical protein GW17_00061894 [Ensete ventricosum]
MATIRSSNKKFKHEKKVKKPKRLAIKNQACLISPPLVSLFVFVFLPLPAPASRLRYNAASSGSPLISLCQSRWLEEGDQEPSLSSPPLVCVFSLFLLLSRLRWLAEFDQERMKLSFSPLVSVFGFVFVFLCLRLQASSARVLPPPEPCPSAMAAMRVCLPHLAKSHYLFWHAYPPPTLQCCAAFSAAIEGPGAACLCLLARQKAFLGTPIETSRLFSLPFACGKPVDAFATEICQDSAPPAPPASAAPPAAAPPAYRINLRFTLTVSLPASVVVVLVLAILIYAIYVRDCSFLELFCRIACMLSG